jgi:hypothetical protein
VTREAAIAAARDQAAQFGKALVVYRFPAWRPDVYGVRGAGELPPQAQTFEQFEPQASAQTVESPAIVAAGQGSLF